MELNNFKPLIYFTINPPTFADSIKISYHSIIIIQITNHIFYFQYNIKKIDILKIKLQLINLPIFSYLQEKPTQSSSLESYTEIRYKTFCKKIKKSIHFHFTIVNQESYTFKTSNLSTKYFPPYGYYYSPNAHYIYLHTIAVITEEIKKT